MPPRQISIPAIANARGKRNGIRFIYKFRFLKLAAICIMAIKVIPAVKAIRPTIALTRNWSSPEGPARESVWIRIDASPCC